MTENQLCNLAVQAMSRAYAPYSYCTVGAALLTTEGKVYTGCNIENASFTPTVCAERTAIFKAISEGDRRFAMLAVAGGQKGLVQGGFPPCGVCRQVLAEFCPPDFPILVVDGNGTFRRYTLSDLLPAAFGPNHMEDSL